MGWSWARSCFRLRTCRRLLALPLCPFAAGMELQRRAASLHRHDLLACQMMSPQRGVTSPTAAAGGGWRMPFYDFLFAREPALSDCILRSDASSSLDQESVAQGGACVGGMLRPTPEGVRHHS
jgi:hypothetical protein